MNEGNYREYGGGISCYFHPKEVVVGVCHLCLNERLLLIAAKQGVSVSVFSKSSFKFFGSKKHNSNYSDDDISSSYHHYHHNPRPNINNNKPYISLPKFFGIASFFHSTDKIRHHLRRHSHRKSNHDLFDTVDFFDDDDASTSLEDESFISIKIGENGVASWDKTSTTTVSKEPKEHCSLSWGGQTSVKDATIKGSSGDNYCPKSVVEHPKPRPPSSLRWRKRIGQLLQVIRWKKSSKATNAGGSGSGGGNNMVVLNNKTYIEDIKYEGPMNKI